MVCFLLRCCKQPRILSPCRWSLRESTLFLIMPADLWNPVWNPRGKNTDVKTLSLRFSLQNGKIRLKLQGSAGRQNISTSFLGHRLCMCWVTSRARYLRRCVHLRCILQSAHVRTWRLMISGRADDSLQDWCETKSLTLHHSSLRAAAGLRDSPQTL